MEHTSEFNTKLEKACHKKEALFDESKMRYALRSMFAGAFLTMSTAAGAHAAQIIAGLNPALSRFIFKRRASYFKYDVLNSGSLPKAH